LRTDYGKKNIWILKRAEKHCIIWSCKNYNLPNIIRRIRQAKHIAYME
jgi:hypothetical protein